MRIIVSLLLWYVCFRFGLDTLVEMATENPDGLALGDRVGVGAMAALFAAVGFWQMVSIYVSIRRLARLPPRSEEELAGRIESVLARLLTIWHPDSDREQGSLEFVVSGISNERTVRRIEQEILYLQGLAGERKLLGSEEQILEACSLIAAYLRAVPGTFTKTGKKLLGEVEKHLPSNGNLQTG